MKASVFGGVLILLCTGAVWADVDNGMLFSINGSVTNGGSEAVNLSVFDKDIHSGVAGTSPCDGMVTDAFVLQGGAPSGCDNNDPYEVAQAPGHFQFLELAGGGNVGYQFDITTDYQFGGSDFNGIGGGPDTGFLTIVNNGASSFSGTLNLFGNSGNGIYGHIVWNETFTGSLGLGESKVFAATTEGSNYGGFNPVTVPEPSSIMLFGSGLLAVVGLLRMRSLAR